MPRELSADEAAALVESTDTMGSGLGPAWPPALMLALGQRDDWQSLTVDGALVTVGTELFTRRGVRYRCGFFGPIERYAKSAGGAIEFVPADFRRFGPLLAQTAPRVMVTAAAPPDDNGYLSLSLHAGGTIDELRKAGADPGRLLIVETSDRFPRTRGDHLIHVDEVDVLIPAGGEPTAVPGKEIDEVDRAIAALAAEHIADGSTLQTGIGSVPEAIAQHLATGPGGGYGIHTEMFNDGLLALHQAGKVTNEKGVNDGVSVTTFALGSRELYDWLHENESVRFLPVEQVNDPHVLVRNKKLVTVNGALTIDLYGQVVADTMNGAQFSGVGGAEDFVSAPAYVEGGNSLLCMHSTAGSADAPINRIVPQLPAGTVVTTPRHQLDILVTEHGSVDLATMTVKERAAAIASVAHPDFRDELREAAAKIPV